LVTTKTKTRRSFTDEFKQEAVSLLASTCSRLVIAHGRLPWYGIDRRSNDNKEVEHHKVKGNIPEMLNIVYAETILNPKNTTAGMRIGWRR
jgi:hypothetical protein